MTAYLNQTGEAFKHEALSVNLLQPRFYFALENRIGKIDEFLNEHPVRFFRTDHLLTTFNSICEEWMNLSPGVHGIEEEPEDYSYQVNKMCDTLDNMWVYLSEQSKEHEYVSKQQILEVWENAENLYSSNDL